MTPDSSLRSFVICAALSWLSERPQSLLSALRSATYEIPWPLHQRKCGNSFGNIMPKSLNVWKHKDEEPLSCCNPWTLKLSSMSCCLVTRKGLFHKEEEGKLTRWEWTGVTGPSWCYINDQLCSLNVKLAWLAWQLKVVAVDCPVKAILCGQGYDKPGKSILRCRQLSEEM